MLLEIGNDIIDWNLPNDLQNRESKYMEYHRRMSQTEMDMLNTLSFQKSEHECDDSSGEIGWSE